MKRKLAWAGVVLSAVYLLTAGPMPDPIPFIDEGLAVALLLKCASYLGYDLLKWLPFLAKKKSSAPSSKHREDKDVTIDV